MSDPNSFVNFADYMGLNDEAGQQMLDKTMTQGDDLRNAAQTSLDAHSAAARSAGEGRAGGEEAFNKTGEQAHAGLASYGEFMAGMADPAKRQALMEKTYGRGATSWLDSAMTGAAGGGRIAAGAKDAADMGGQFAAADARRGRYADQTAQQKAADDAYGAEQAAAATAKEKDRLGRERALRQLDENLGDYDSVGYRLRARLGREPTQREKEMEVNTSTAGSRAKDPRNGAGPVDWDSYFKNQENWRLRAHHKNQEYGRGTWSDLSFGAGLRDPTKDESWATYYANKTKKPGVP